MKEQIKQAEPRYMKISEEVVFGLGGYFQRQLATINRKRGELSDLQQHKEEKRKGLSKNKLIKMMQIVSYGDWLTDYETEQIAGLDMSRTRLTEVMAEVITLGRVDRAEAELLATIAACFGYLKSGVRASDSIGRKSASATMKILEEAIEALSIINPDTAQEYNEFLNGIGEGEEFWFG